jgi:hypothetical protein
MKDMISQACLLYNPDMNKELILETDASSSGLGAVLLQRGPDGHEHPVQFLSRALSDTESRYSAQEKECLAIMWAIDKLKHNAVGNPKVLIITDHESLQWMLSPTQKNNKISKWAARFKALNAKIVYRTGVTNLKADFLSRHYPPQEPVEGMGEYEDVVALMSSTKSPVWTNAKELAALQDNDEFCKLFKKLKSNQERKEFAHSRGIATFHYNDNGVLLADVPHKRNPRTVIVAPKAIVNDVLEALHDWPQGGHLGRAKTVARVRVQFYWPTL